MSKRWSKDYAIAQKIAVEGGYVNDPSDSGGETNYGITKAVAVMNRKLWPRFSWDGDMRTMPVEFAHELYTRKYWNRMRLDDIHAESVLVADLLLDLAINLGVSRATKFLQRHLNLSNQGGTSWDDIAEDGALGNGTLRALKGYLAVRGSNGKVVMLTALLCAQGDFYSQLTARREKDERFYFGWMSRVKDHLIEYTEALDEGIL